MEKWVKKITNKIYGGKWGCFNIIVSYVILLIICGVGGDLWRNHVIFSVGFDGILLLFY